MDFEAQDDGVLAKILVEANSGDINVGDPIMITVEDEEHVAAFENYVLEGGAAAPAAASVAPSDPEPASPPANVPAPPTSTPTPAPVAGSQGGTVIASPLARMLAQEKGVDIAQIPGTGPGGRIIAADVQEFQPSASMVSGDVASAPAATTATTFSSMDWAAHSKQNVPHYYLTVDINVDALQALRESTLSEISIHSCLIKAACLSMKTVPAVNAAYLGDITRYYEHVDVQVVGDSNIIVPHGSSLGLSAIEAIVTDESKADDAAVGTFSFCNLGMYGISSCAPIIREPQACALAVGALETQIVPSGDVDIPYKTVTQLTATLSCDHRVVDGAVGAQWLATFKNYVENPTTLLL